MKKYILASILSSSLLLASNANAFLFDPVELLKEINRSNQINAAKKKRLRQVVSEYADILTANKTCVATEQAKLVATAKTIAANGVSRKKTPLETLSAATDYQYLGFQARRIFETKKAYCDQLAMDKLKNLKERLR